MDPTADDVSQDGTRIVHVTTGLAWVGPPTLLLTLLGLSIHQRGFLADVGWDPIGRTDTQWPSLMALGPDGWLLTLAFVLGSGSALGLAASIALTARTGADRVLVAVCVVLAIGLACVSFSADLPGQTRTWHAVLHNGGYPLIPLATLAGAIVTSRHSARRAPAASRAIFVVIAITYPLTGVDAIAQLSRYVLFVALMCWVVLLTMTQRTRAAGADIKV